MSFRILARLLSVGGTLLGLCGPVGAAAPACEEYSDEQNKLCERSMKVASEDFAVPDAPAFAILGVSPSSIVHSGSTNDFALSLLNAVDDEGRLQTGLAYDFSPYMTFVGRQVTLADYQQSRAARFLTNTRLSFATTRAGDGDDESGRIGAGLRLTPWRLNDRRLDADYNQCLGNALSDALSSQPPPPPLPRSATQEEIDAAEVSWAEQALKSLSLIACESMAPAEGGFTIGVAKAWQGREEGFDDLSASKGSAWATLSVPIALDRIPGFEGSLQLSIQGQYDEGELVEVDSLPGAIIRQDVSTLATSLRLPEGDLGMLSDFSLNLEGRFVDADRDSGAQDDRFEVYVLQARFRVLDLSESVWLNFSLGQTRGREDGGETFGGLSLGWGQSERTLSTF